MGRIATTSVVLGLAAMLAGCGRSSHTAAPATTTTHKPTEATTTASGPGALQAEANAAAAGDIPDNQVFLVFHEPGYSMKYPEGWAQHGSGRTVVFRDKNNIIRIDVGAAPAPTRASITQELRRLKGSRIVAGPQPIQVPAGRAYKVVYSTESAPNPVTGKRVTLVVDRYYLGLGRRRAVVELGTPVGVDNVDAYRLMIESFRWR